MIYRTVKDKDNRYVRLNVGAANDERLSYKAIGIHTYIMTKPNGWEANETDITRRHADGLASVRSGVKELIQHGYMVRVRIVDAQKRIRGWRIDTYETPDLNPHHHPDEPAPDHIDELTPDYIDEPDRDNPHLENPHLENPHLENRNHSNNRIAVKIDSSKDRSSLAAAAPHDDDDWRRVVETMHRCGVPLSGYMSEQYQEMLKEYGINAVLLGLENAANNGKASRLRYVQQCIASAADGFSPEHRNGHRVALVAEEGDL